jgi:hypothetical protein
MRFEYRCDKFTTCGVVVMGVREEEGKVMR